MNDLVRKTNKIVVELMLTEGNSVRASLFVPDLERVTDLLNDPRRFIPYEDISGQVRVVNKSMIVSVIPLDENNIERRERPLDPTSSDND